VGIVVRFAHATQDDTPAPAPNFRDGATVQAILAALDAAIATRSWVALTSQPPSPAGKGE
jgi:predicted dehydrogenase